MNQEELANLRKASSKI